MTRTYPRFTSIDALQRAHRGCRRCVDAGLLPAAHPVFSGHAGQRILLVGQAPGPVERDQTRPFAGRAGMQLMRWLARAGLEDEQAVRDRIYMTAMTTCFPGRRVAGGGDRRPSAREIALCSAWLDSVLALLQPRLIISVGTLSQSRFLPGLRLDDTVGNAYGASLAPVTGVPDDPSVVVPLPHPSGQSRWLNEPARARLLERALQRLGELVPWAERVES
ncbi:MAG: uracil-DNA glycosylase [Candidatus Dormibacteraeota bacterium]|nr:uracil-DNA glycosylase [Candidatus Dormibacteraeota bacterium]